MSTLVVYAIFITTAGLLGPRTVKPNPDFQVRACHDLQAPGVNYAANVQQDLCVASDAVQWCSRREYCAYEGSGTDTCVVWDAYCKVGAN